MVLVRFGEGKLILDLYLGETSHQHMQRKRVGEKGRRESVDLRIDRSCSKYTSKKLVSEYNILPLAVLMSSFAPFH